jgi:hypothetical protein
MSNKMQGLKTQAADELYNICANKNYQNVGAVEVNLKNNWHRPTK